MLTNNFVWVLFCELFPSNFLMMGIFSTEEKAAAEKTKLASPGEKWYIQRKVIE